MQSLRRTLPVLLGAGLLTAGLSFTAAADGDIEEYLDHHLGMTLEQTVRKFDKLCLEDEKVRIRLQPNTFDYYYKPSPSGPPTLAEHARHLLVMSEGDIEGFRAQVETAGVDNPFTNMMLAEMKKGLDRLALLDAAALELLPPCGEPFKEPAGPKPNAPGQPS